jgi:cysteine-rich repeat protein
MDVPTDLTQSVIQALIEDATQPSGYRVLTGIDSADGSFTIRGVTDGVPYLMKLDTSYYATTAHALDVRNEVPVRGPPPPTEASSLTKVQFNIQGMSPFVRGPEGTISHISIDSPNLGYQGRFEGLKNNASFLMVDYDWITGSSADGAHPLPDGSRGDDLVLSHLRTDRIVTPSFRKQRLTRSIDTALHPSVTIVDGATTNINGTWATTTSDRPLNLSITRSIFDSSYDGTTQFTAMSVSLLAHPVPNSTGLGMKLFTADLADWSHSSSLSENLSFVYADLFPSSWSRTFTISYSRSRFMRLPNTVTPLVLDASNVRVFSYTGGTPDTSPALQPPSNFAIAGNPATLGGNAAFNGVAPLEVTWSGVATADFYSVRVDRVLQNGPQTQRAAAATLSTKQTAIRIPAEVFAGSEFFVFTVTAINSSASYDTGQLKPYGLPFSSASTVSGLFRLGNRCGNGVADQGEQCDAGGETATCDIDCTLPLCGDGLHNAAAGEACDTIRDTSTCDTDCTLVVCGDNRVNLSTEDCDDGNATDQGNGCSAGCRFNNVCGDGIRQALAEACDSGGIDTSTCDADCTAIQCGDGHRNAAANEQCDDGNLDNTDGCNTMCIASI